LNPLARRHSASRPSKRTAAPRSSSRLRTWRRLTLVALAVLALDRLSKQAVESSIQLGEERSFLPGIQLVHTHNSGVAFGLLGGAHAYLTIAIAVVIVLALGYFATRTAHRLAWLPTGMIIGGALGNVIDRLRFGYVTDFVKLPLGWPPFNLADAAITVGVLLLMLIIGRSGSEETADG
jgi:signal peptidase II